MIELAPNNKIGLSLRSPVLVAGGVLGIGDPIPSAIREADVGAIVVGPITHSSRRGVAPPRLCEFTGGFVMNNGLQNRGVRNAVKRLSRTRNRVKNRADCPLIAQVADRESHHLRRVVEYLERSGVCDGLELLVHPESDCDELHGLLSVLHEVWELPIWAKVPFGCSANIIACAVDGGADAIVVSQPPTGAYVRKSVTDDDNGVSSHDALISGSTFGTGTLPLLLSQVDAIAALGLPVPIILCGGVHNEHDVDAALVAGASAVQLDGALWVEPGLAKLLALHCQVAC